MTARKQDDMNMRYWIAINGASCALCSHPLKNPVTSPVAQQLVGFPTLEEAKEAQRICLYEKIEVTNEFLKSLVPHVMSGRIRVIQPSSPETPTEGPTGWMEHEQAKQMILDLEAHA
jgi:hypothetical protein